MNQESNKEGLTNSTYDDVGVEKQAPILRPDKQRSYSHNSSALPHESPRGGTKLNTKKISSKISSTHVSQHNRNDSKKINLDIS